MAEIVLQTQRLTKKYEDVVAVDALDLTVQAGEVFGMLGPNGAGKTTTILMLLGLTEPTRGKVRVLGFDPARRPLSVKSLVGYLPDQVGFYDELTARENLVYTARLNGLPRQEAYRRIAEVIQRVGLEEVEQHKVGTFSRGMRQRLGVADVLLKQPRLVILDEPTQGLDPEGAREFLQIIRSLKEEGITVLLASHLLHQVQAVCDRVGLFYKGRMVLEGAVAELGQKVLGKAYRIHLEASGSQAEIGAALLQVPGAVDVRILDGSIYQVEAEGDIRPEAASAVISAGGRLLNLGVETQSLDEIYARYFEEVEHGNRGKAARSTAG